MKNKIITYQDIIAVKNLYTSWQEFLPGKKNKNDIAEFSLNLSGNIFKLHRDLKDKNYKHDDYTAFNISDPKPRDIHKASVKDRLLHHAVYRIIYPYFDKLFIFDSYSCRNFKGTHKALKRFEKLNRKVSQNNTKQCWILKCDIKKCFASIDQKIVIRIMKKFIKDQNIIWLIERIINSFKSFDEFKGLPLGNLTSQIIVNIYLNELDQFIKNKLKIKYYMRYADDFVIFFRDKDYLWELVPKISNFLDEELKLKLHPHKLFVQTLSSGVDFLGWVHFPRHRVLRTATKRKMFRNIKLKTDEKIEDTINSYLGMLKWGNGRKLGNEIRNKQ
ncbi:MAG: group II intron reverse transcriptase domain-containing protein [Candidatus Zambryskibacteria bacterium]|nr:group II intron reverse transcriptase domain-containing protein [Candidatus Zambryskibacteria bacterium]